MTYQFYSANELHPRGWVLRQLQLQAEGLNGNLDKIWPDVRDSAWIGGDREGWERVPYWLDGFIPLAYLLENENMIARVRRYIDAILAYQEEDGWICPCPPEKRDTYDLWAVLLIGKVLTVYYECSHDERAVDALYRTMKNLHGLLSTEKATLWHWGKYRWFEGMIALSFLQKHYSETWIEELAGLLEAQGADYASFTDRWKRPLNHSTLETHIVNLAMMLKYEAVSHTLLHRPYTDKAETLHRVLAEYNRTPVGLFTGDECLSGRSPIQGTELCAVVEQMYSYELLYAHTGDPKWAERLELLAFNALPATISDDMWAHQYDQMSNQIACQRFPGRSIFRTNGGEAHLFGLEPNYGCCTANFGQGWPKLALSSFLHSEDGRTVLSAVTIPSELSEKRCHILLETKYPFANTFTYHVEAKEEFTLAVRIPSFAKQLKVDGNEVPTQATLSFSFRPGEKRVIVISFTTEVNLFPTSGKLFSVRKGSLIYALPIPYEAHRLEYEKWGVERKYPYCDYEYLPLSDWSYAFTSETFTETFCDLSDIPFSSQHPPVTLQGKLCRIDWGMEDGFEAVCAKAPNDTAPLAPPEDITLYPYGCTRLRMTELPFADGYGRKEQP